MTADDSGATPRDVDTGDDAVPGAPDGGSAGDSARGGGGAGDAPADGSAPAGTDPARAASEGAPAAREADDENTIAIRLEQLILGADRRYTPFQAARGAGVSMDLAARFWRAMGFADIGQVKALTEADVL
ncbi:adenylate/guanylate cyclase domain-containing protein, partial [Streptomyces kronopolitis]